MEKVLQKQGVDPIEEKIHCQTKIYNDNTKKIKGLLLLNIPPIEIASILKLDARTVANRIKVIQLADLTNTKFIKLANEAVKKNLKDGSLKAAAMVYDRLQPKAADQAKILSSKVPNIQITLDISSLKQGIAQKVIDVNDCYDDRSSERV